MPTVLDDSKPPRVGLVIVNLIYGGMGAGAVVWTALHGSALALLAVIVVCSLLGIALIKPLSTELSATGVSQRTWSGRTQLLWGDVTSVGYDGHGYELKSASARMRVPLIFFNDYGAACAYVESHLPPHLQQT
jgi:hypothetical protein